MASRGNGFNNNRGRGRGRGRGAPTSRGQPGRGWTNGGRDNSRGRGRGRSAYNNLDVIDVDIQRYADETPASGSAFFIPQSRGRGSYRSRGRGRTTSTPINLQVFTNGRGPPSPRREDWDSKPAVRGQSRGLGAKYHYDTPLSKLLAMDRPYLRPINFIPAQLTPVLFQHEEELIEVHKFGELEDHVPTAEQVSRVFSQQESHPSQQDSYFQDPKIDLFEATDSEPIITVDFASLGKLLGDTSVSQSPHKPETEPPETNEVTNAPEPDVPENGQALNAFDAIMQALSIDSKEPANATSSVTRPEGNIDNTNDHSHVEKITSAAASTKGIKEADRNQEEKDEEQPSFVVDSSPSQPSEQRVDVKYASIINCSQPLGSTLHDDEEVIVYDAPLPRSGRTTPSISGAADRPPVAPSTAGTRLSVMSGTSRPTIVEESTLVGPSSMKGSAPVATGAFAGMSFSFDTISQVAEVNREQTASPRARRLTKRDRKNRAAQRNGKRRSSFGIFGALLEERHLYEEDLGLSRTRGKLEGSDIDWGDGDDDSDDIKAISSSLGGMDIDGDLGVQAMQSFVDSMSKKGMEHTTIDDIEDARKLQLEDESSNEDQEVDSEVEIALEAEEERLFGEANGAPESTSEPDEDEEEDDDDVSSDEEETPVRNFQARLTRVRQSAKARRKMKEPVLSVAQGPNGNLFSGRMSGLRDRGKQGEEESEDDGFHDDSDDFDAEEEDEDYLDDLQDLLDEEDDILISDRKQKKAFFKAVMNGDFSSAPAKKKRDYGKDLPPELRAQWEKDRAKKAENKRKRAAARLQVAADPFAKHKGGKKGRKAMLRAARLAEEAREEAPPNAGPDMAILVRQMRMYLDDLNFTGPMALPPMDKASRAKIHEVAAAFGLKSHSKGKGDARYTTLIKTSRSGIQIDERKIERILRAGGNWGFTRSRNPGGGRGKGSGTPEHREGDEVGKAAPKIGESNIGFRMLAQMGWAEGEKIGISGGLDAPLKAVIKNSKLGLGATR